MAKKYATLSFAGNPHSRQAMYAQAELRAQRNS